MIWCIASLGSEFWRKIRTDAPKRRCVTLDEPAMAQ
jgi:hypothetical protein